MSTFRRSKLSLQSLRIYTHNTSVSSIRGQASKIHLVNGGGSKISASNPAMYSSTAHPYSSVSHMFRRSGGKIVVFTGLLDHLQSDAEIATIVGHEVGHAVAQHVGEKFSKKLLIIIVKLLSEKAPKAKWLPKYLLTLPFSRKMEAEADHIGLMLMASAGYDPRAAPTVYEKLEKLSKEKSAMSKYFSSHLSRGKRYPLLTRAPVMEEAVTLYNETMAERGADRFFDNGVMAD
ncbi:Mitochondrial metalloendopeptidase OMA1 [Linum grandiflorum]